MMSLLDTLQPIWTWARRTLSALCIILVIGHAGCPSSFRNPLICQGGQSAGGCTSYPGSFPPGTYGGLQYPFLGCSRGSCPCPSNAYCPGDGLIYECPPGRYGNGQTRQGSVDGACNLCPAGTAQGTAGCDSCGACLAGSYSDQGQGGCSPCPAGRSGSQASQQGVGGCAPCPPGRYSAVGSSVCSPCDAGLAQSSAGSSACEICPPGTFAGTAAATCSPCPMGTYSAYPGQSSLGSCLNCARGTFGNTSAQRDPDECHACPEGTFNPNPGGQLLQACEFCPAGTYSKTRQATAVGACLLCAAGKSSAQGSTACIACPMGYYSSTSGTCEICGAGKFLPAGASDFCRECGPGTFSGSGAALCTACSPGRYQGGSGAGACIACDINQFSFANATNCLPCAVGKVTATTGQGVCTPPLSTSAIGASAGLNAIAGNGLVPSLICAFAFLYLLLGLAVVKVREGHESVSKLDSVYTLTSAAVLGGSLVMEVVLIIGMFESPFPAVGAAILIARMLHMPASVYVLAAIFAPTRLRALLALPEGAKLDIMLAKEHLLDNVKIYGTIAGLALIESSLLQFLPWLASDFASATYGCPDMFLLRLLAGVKILQSVISSLAQLSFLILSKGLPRDPQAQAFLACNITLTLLLVFLKAFEAIARANVVKTLPTCFVEAQRQEQRSLPKWLEESLPGVPEASIRSLITALRKDDIVTLKSLFECKAEGVIGEAEIKELGAGAKLNKRQILALLVAFKALSVDTVRDTIVEPTPTEGKLAADDKLPSQPADSLAVSVELSMIPPRRLQFAPGTSVDNPIHERATHHDGRSTSSEGPGGVETLTDVIPPPV